MKDSAWMNKTVSLGVLIKWFEHKSLFFPTVTRKINPKCLLISLQHIVEAVRIAILLWLLWVKGKVHILPLRKLLLTVEFEKVLKFILANIPYFEPFLNHHFFFVCLFECLSVLLHLYRLIPFAFVGQHSMLVKFHIFLYPRISIILHACQTQTHWMGTLYSFAFYVLWRIFLRLIVKLGLRWMLLLLLLLCFGLLHS